MNTKINLQQLAKILAQKKSIPQKDAETFLKEFFDSIVQNVTSDKLVKIKGLGTFKLIEVLDRESVNVNTGERFVIPGHSKLSFTPEPALKDLINKPFADFQTTVINEGTPIEDMEWTPQATLDDQGESQPPLGGEEEAEEEQTLSNSPNLSPEPEEERSETPEVEEAPVQKLVEEPVCLYGPPPVERVQEPVEAPKPEPKVEETPAPKQEENGAKNPHSIGKILAWVLGILLLCLLVFFAYRALSDSSQKVQDSEQVEPQVEAPVEVEETPAPEEQYAQVPGGKYKIVGTKKTYVMKPGDFLTRIAIQEYGDKDVAQYIIVHNNFPDPDNVPVDAEIKLPELVPVE